ncbi:unnamed protein product, partial [Mesorhabditis spiculigera]
MDMIPLSFILSFFVTAVVARWTHMLNNIGLIDNLALTAAFHIHGTTERARMLRRNIVRYAVQMQLLVFRDVSTQVRKRFPTIESTVTANFFSADEMETYLNYDNTYTMAKYWMPIVWAQNAIHMAKKEGLIQSDIQYNHMWQVLMEWRSQLAQIVHYDWVPLPLMNLKIGLAIADRGCSHLAPLEKDPHWDSAQPLLYSQYSRPVNALYGSAVGMDDSKSPMARRKSTQFNMVPLEGVLEETPACRKPTRIVAPPKSAMAQKKFSRSRIGSASDSLSTMTSIPGTPKNGHPTPFLPTIQLNLIDEADEAGRDVERGHPANHFLANGKKKPEGGNDEKF